MADLKPCPFCGRIPMVEDCGDNRYFVRCKCGMAQDKLYGQRCDAVRRWNTRKPSADVQPVHTGEWIYGEKDGADGWYCSECKFHIPWYYDYYGLNNINFIKDFHTCPHCDAKMLKYTGMEREQNA